MSETTSTEPYLRSWSTLAFSALRVAIGILWALLAVETWTQSFLTHVYHFHETVFTNLPGWLMWWFGSWVSLIAPVPALWVGLARFLVTLVAIFMIIGFARKTTYIVGIIVSLPLWTLMEGYAPSQALDSISLATALTYILIFISLILAERHDGTPPYSIDYYLGQAWPTWWRVSEWNGKNTNKRNIKPLRWSEQAPIILIIALVLAVLITGSTHSVNLVNSNTTTTAATSASATGNLAPSGLIQIIGNNPVSSPNPVELPPLIGTGKSVNVHMEFNEKILEIGAGIKYQAWTFDTSVPGPVLHVREGQTVNITLKNNTAMPHSLDLHAAEVAPNVNYAEVKPNGGTLSVSFVAHVPGAFIYHCGTPPVLEHMANGMYGVIIVDPIKPLPPADKSYVLEESEFYTQLVSGNTYKGNYAKMLASSPDLVVFNGKAFQYKDHPLPAKAGKRIRIYFVNGGVTKWSAFHVIGGIFEKVYPGGDMSQSISGVSTYSVAPGEGTIFDIILPVPGHYAVVDHDMSNMAKGAMGMFDVK